MLRFEELIVIPRSEASDGPTNMAIDEWLVFHTRYPTIRFYGWDGDWSSFGYSQSFSEVTRSDPNLLWVRRWTGGGMVDHRKDFTFSLIIPPEHPFARIRPILSYEQLHKAIADALQATGQNAMLLKDKPAPGLECFVSPSQFDVMVGNRKVVGGAQRRTRHGILHQGSIQGVTINTDFQDALVANMAAKTKEPKAFDLQAIEKLAEKYRSSEWLRRR